MADEIPDLWPDDLNVSVLSPLAILKVQQQKIGQRTRKLLEAEVRRIESDKWVSYEFDLTAPSLEGGYTETVLKATHEKGKYYPVTVSAQCFLPSGFDGDYHEGPSGLMDDERQATTDVEFIDLVRDVLRSSEVRALISSLLASVNEQNEAKAAAAG